MTTVASDVLISRNQQPDFRATSVARLTRRVIDLERRIEEHRGAIRILEAERTTAKGQLKFFQAARERNTHRRGRGNSQE
jgi:hypothetical protein